MRRMRILIVGDDPQILALAYYILKISTDHDVTIAYTREDKVFKDEVIGLEVPFTEKHLSSLGCRIERLTDIDPSSYDLKIDFLSYRIEGYERGDYVLGLGPIEVKIAEAKNVPIYAEENYYDVDSDIMRYIKQRVELKRRYRPVRVIYGVRHIEKPDLEIGYGSTSRFQSINTMFKDPICILRHCIYTSVLVVMGMLDKVHEFPSWLSFKLNNLQIVKYGPSSEEILRRGFSPTTITFTVDDVYIKVLSLYKRPPIAFQCVGPHEQVPDKISMLHGLVSSSMSTVLMRILSIPSLFYRSWIDVVVEMIVRECFWLVHM